MAPKWGAGNHCPACGKTVYPNEQIFCEDRKPFHRSCIKCGTRGCGNQLRAGGIHRHENINVCDRCHNEVYSPAKEYGVPPGKESMDERRLRLAKVKYDYEKSLTEFDAKIMEQEFQAQANHTHLKIAGLMSYAPDKEYEMKNLDELMRNGN